MLRNKLKPYKIILASGSPRRQQLLREMGIEFEILTKSIEEAYPSRLKGSEISDFLAELKANAFAETLQPNEILITADTVVWYQNKSLAKARNLKEAEHMLQELSGHWHDVITSVCFTTTKAKTIVNQVTKVKFKTLSAQEIYFYIDQCKPFDKAGAYGIQDWIGLIGIEEIQGSYTNVVGLPTHLVYKTLSDIVGKGVFGNFGDMG